MLGVVWILDALVQAKPTNFAHSFPLGHLAQSVMGAPPWESHAIYWLLSPFATNWAWWNLGAVLLQASIGFALVVDRGVRVALAGSFVWSGVVWFAGEGLGLLPTGFAMLAFGAPGAVVLYAAVGALAWPVEHRRDVDRRWWTLTWVSVWGGGVMLQIPWVYSARQVLTANFEEASLGQPTWLEAMARTAAHVVTGAPDAWAIGLAVIEAIVALAVLLPPALPGTAPRVDARWTLAAAIGLSLAFWVVGQQLGGILSPSATDIDTAPLVILLALAAWPGVSRPAIRPRS